MMALFWSMHRNFLLLSQLINALITMALLPLSMHRRLHCCQTSIIALVTHHQTVIIALIVMASLPSISRHLCCCYNCNCCPHDNCVVAVVNAHASLPLSSWHYFPCNNSNIVFDPGWYSYLCHDGIVAILKLALSPLLQIVS